MLEQQNVERGHWAAEASLWTSWTHRGLLKAQTSCRLLAIDSLKAVDHLITHRTPQGFAQLYAKKYVEELNDARGDVTDIGHANDCCDIRGAALKVFRKKELKRLDSNKSLTSTASQAVVQRVSSAFRGLRQQ